jgi:threonine dehydrogenase-like Zn-dependent dehydrogenase
MSERSRAIVFNGDETWETRDLPVPDPQPGGAVMRVESTGLCHSDVDHFQGIVHTSWGGAYPSIAGHEIVGRIEKITPDAAATWGVSEGDRVAVRELVVTPEGYRIYGHDFSVDEGSGLYGGFADHLELLPGSMVYRLRDDRPAAELTFFEPLSCAVTWVEPVKQDDVVVIEGPGHMGMATIVAARARPTRESGRSVS